MKALLALGLIASNACPASAEEPEVLVDPVSGSAGAADSFHRATHPRILTVLTTYNVRTPYIKAYRDAMANRTDGYAPTVSAERMRLVSQAYDICTM